MGSPPLRHLRLGVCIKVRVRVTARLRVRVWVWVWVWALASATCLWGYRRGVGLGFESQLGFGHSWRARTWGTEGFTLPGCPPFKFRPQQSNIPPCTRTSREGKSSGIRVGVKSSVNEGSRGVTEGLLRIGCIWVLLTKKVYRSLDQESWGWITNRNWGIENVFISIDRSSQRKQHVGKTEYRTGLWEVGKLASGRIY